MNPRSGFHLRFGIRWLLLLILFASCGLAYWRFRAEQIAERERAIQLLASAPNPLGWDFNPTSLVRAVNSLHALGRDDALAALDEFVTEYSNEGYSCPHQSLEIVMPLLFDRRNPEEKLPRPANSFDPSEGIVLSEDKWDILIDVEDGIPFHTVVIGGAFGKCGDQGYLISWARDHARLRTSPMIPGDPVHAAETVMHRIQENEGEESEATLRTNLHIREQVYRVIQHLLDVSDEDDDSLVPYNDERWENLKRICSDLEIYWDEEAQNFQSKQASGGR